MFLTYITYSGNIFHARARVCVSESSSFTDVQNNFCKYINSVSTRHKSNLFTVSFLYMGLLYNVINWISANSCISLFAEACVNIYFYRYYARVYIFIFNLKYAVATFSSRFVSYKAEEYSLVA